ncbi:MAG: hypothetical protein IJG62_00485, partial [Synergistaceae bacterium]|nr:hypothetical protein [Synergistaceae bacterium]
NNISFPIKKGDKIGTLYLKIDNKITKEIDLITAKLGVEANVVLLISCKQYAKNVPPLAVQEWVSVVNTMNKYSKETKYIGMVFSSTGFSNGSEAWATTNNISLVPPLKGTQIKIDEELIQVLNVEPDLISLNEWRKINELGPFGNDNPCPLFYTPHTSIDRVEPLGRDGKHSLVRINNAKLLAFNVEPGDLNSANSDIEGWVYHPRVDFWRGEEQIQFILDYAVTRGQSEV